MPYIYPLLGWVFVVFCQIVLVPRLEVSRIYPDILLVVVTLLGLKQGWRIGLWFGFAVGTTIALLDPLNFGWVVLLISLAGFLAGIIKEKIFVESGPYQIGVLLVLIFVYQLLFRLISWPKYLFDNILDSLLEALLISIYSALVGSVGLWLVKQRVHLRKLL